MLPPEPDHWADLGDEALLDVRMSDLPLAVEGTLAGIVAAFVVALAAGGPTDALAGLGLGTGGQRPDLPVGQREGGALAGVRHDRVCYRGLIRSAL